MSAAVPATVPARKSKNAAPMVASGEPAETESKNGSGSDPISDVGNPATDGALKKAMMECDSAAVMTGSGEIPSVASSHTEVSQIPSERPVSANGPPGTSAASVARNEPMILSLATRSNDVEARQAVAEKQYTTAGTRPVIVRSHPHIHARHSPNDNPPPSHAPLCPPASFQGVTQTFIVRPKAQPYPRCTEQ